MYYTLIKERIYIKLSEIHYKQPLKNNLNILYIISSN